MAFKAKKVKKKAASARVNKITGRHTEEMKLMVYIRRLDKIYTDLNMPGTFLKVVQLLRRKYKDNPHELYLKVCKKWGVEPKDEVDSEFLVYGRSRSPSCSRRSLLKKQSENKNIKEHENKEEKEAAEEQTLEAPVTASSSVDKYLESQDKPEVKTDHTVQVAINKKVEFVRVLPGDIIETMVLIESTSDKETGFWVPAQILSINENANNMDLQILQPLKYNLAEKAVDVPYRYIRAPATVTFVS